MSENNNNCFPAIDPVMHFINLKIGKAYILKFKDKSREIPLVFWAYFDRYKGPVEFKKLRIGDIVTVVDLKIDKNNKRHKKLVIIHLLYKGYVGELALSDSDINHCFEKLVTDE